MRFHRKIFLSVVALMGIGLGQVYLKNLEWFFSVSSATKLIQGQWPLVLFYVLMFSVFVFFLAKNPLRKDSWKKTDGVYLAFVTALFAEMFGFSLTVYLLSALPVFSASGMVAYSPPTVAQVNLVGLSFELLLTSLVAGLVSLLCFFVIILGWKQVYYSKKLVTTGVYSVVRHPQYSAMISVAIVWAISWPTFLTLLLCPILVFAYYKLARDEEKELEKRFPEYKEYKKKVPMLVP
jgi:protein-S-isoprenylcysteine O-methyltransferase Ste14